MNTTASATMGIVKTADGVPLKVRLREVERRKQVISLLFVAPLTLFLLALFVFPIVSMSKHAIDNSEFHEAIPKTLQAVRAWNGTGVPDESVFAVFVEELRDVYNNKERSIVGKLAKRVNYEISASRALILNTARFAGRQAQGPYKQALIDFDKRWGEPAYWAMMIRNTSPYTEFYFVSAVDHQRNEANELVKLPRDQAIFFDVYVRTFWISGLVTLGCLILGYPVAFLLANVSTRISNMLMFFVLLPFWTALLVRTTAWMVLLQRHGLINDFLKKLGLIHEPLQLILNLGGILVAMIHVLLPFMILPLFSVMKGIDRQHMRAARSLGANSFFAFYRVYFPQSLPGVSSGGLLVFILALGYYITPRLVGGPADQMISHFIAFYTDELLNWGQASALALLLLAITMVLYVFYHRFVGIESTRLG